jgi:hypothetical protein
MTERETLRVVLKKMGIPFQDVHHEHDDRKLRAVALDIGTTFARNGGYVLEGTLDIVFDEKGDYVETVSLPTKLLVGEWCDEKGGVINAVGFVEDDDQENCRG